mgnify:CR=1 FL=1
MATLYWPFSVATVTEWPGQRPGSYHIGTDFGIRQGTPLRATVDGKVSRWVDQYGAYIIDIVADDGLLVRNGHLSRIDVSNGQRVTAGQIIGLTGGIPGTPGAGWSTGAHLHWELRRGAAWYDPRTIQPQPINFGDNPVTPDDDEDDDMAKTSGFYYKRSSDGVQITLLVNPVSGWFHEYQSGSADYNNAVARAFDTGNHAPITESHRDALWDSCQRLMKGK